jgi:hypothetical protein
MANGLVKWNILLCTVNRSSHFLSQDRQWLSKIGHLIVPLDRSFEFSGQDGQWFNQMGHPIVPLHVHAFVTIT